MSIRTKQPEPARMLDDAGDVRERRLLVESEPEVRELERDVGAQRFRGQAIEDALVLEDDVRGLLRAADVLAEERRVHLEPEIVQPAQHRHALVQGLAGDEPRGAEPHPVAVDDLSQPRAVGGAQDGRARERLQAQFSDGSYGIRARTPNGPPLRRRTSAQSASGSSVKTSSGSAGSTIHDPSSSSSSS